MKEVVVRIRVERHRIRPRLLDEIQVGDRFVVAHRLAEVTQPDRERDGDDAEERDAVVARFVPPSFAQLFEEHHARGAFKR